MMCPPGRQRERPNLWIQNSWYDQGVQPLSSPGGAPPPALGWGIGGSGPSALKSSQAEKFWDENNASNAKIEAKNGRNYRFMRTL